MARIVILTTMLLLVATLAWSSVFYFRFPERLKLWYRLTIYACLAIHAAAIGLSPPPHPGLIVAGLVLAAISLGLFWNAVWSHRRQRPSYAFIQAAPETLVRCGPYRFIRHPFYVAFVVAALAGTVLSGQVLLALTVVWVGVMYYWAAREEEARFLKSEFGREYAQYQSETGMFLPRLRRARALPSMPPPPPVPEIKQP